MIKPPVKHHYASSEPLSLIELKLILCMLLLKDIYTI